MREFYLRTLLPWPAPVTGSAPVAADLTEVRTALERIALRAKAEGRSFAGVLRDHLLQRLGGRSARTRGQDGSDSGPACIVAEGEGPWGPDMAEDLEPHERSVAPAWEGPGPAEGSRARSRSGAL